MRSRRLRLFSQQATTVMRCINPFHQQATRAIRLCALLFLTANLLAQQTPSTPAVQLPDAPSTCVLSGTVTDTDEAVISNAHITLENVETEIISTAEPNIAGEFS